MFKIGFDKVAGVVSKHLKNVGLGKGTAAGGEARESLARQIREMRQMNKNVPQNPLLSSTSLIKTRDGKHAKATLKYEKSRVKSMDIK